VGIKPAQPANSLNLAGIADLKIKYVEPLREHVIEPLRADLVRMQAQLRGEISGADLAATTKAEHEIQQIDRALRVLELELERAMTLRLSDFDVPAGVVAPATELTAR